VIGPVICLGAVERRPVAYALTVLAGGLNNLFDIVVNGESAVKYVFSQLKEQQVEEFNVLNLQVGNGKI
jgi:lipoprotein signal peptidase